MQVKIVIALFMRGRSELPEELWRVGAKMVTASVNRREPSSLLKATKAAIPMTMTTARAMGPNAKYPKKAPMNAKEVVRKRTCGRKNRDACSVLDRGASFIPFLDLTHHSAQPFVMERRLDTMPTYWKAPAVSSSGGPMISWM